MGNSLENIITTRRSVFPAQYTGKEIPQADLLAVLEAARWAPNHAKTQPWRYKVLTGNALDRLATFLTESYKKVPDFKEFTLSKLGDNTRAASAIILIFMERDEKQRIPEWEEVAATAMSVQNMWLTAHSLGHGAYWSSPKSFADMNDFNDLEISNKERFLGFFFMGSYDAIEQPLPERLAVTEFTQFID